MKPRQLMSFTVTAETDLSGGKANDFAQLPWYYCEYDTATGDLKTDHRFAKLPEGLELEFKYDPKYEIRKGWDGKPLDQVKGELDSMVKVKANSHTLELENFLTVDSIGKNYALLFSGGKDGKKTTVTVGQEQVERWQEQIYFIPSVQFRPVGGWKSPKGKTPDIECIVMNPTKPITLNFYVTQALNTQLPTDIESVWELDPDDFEANHIDVNPDEREYGNCPVAKTT